jgi:hypothetical protein
MEQHRQGNLLAVNTVATVDLLESRGGDSAPQQERGCCITARNDGCLSGWLMTFFNYNYDTFN